MVTAMHPLSALWFLISGLGVIGIHTIILHKLSPGTRSKGRGGRGFSNDGNGTGFFDWGGDGFSGWSGSDSGDHHSGWGSEDGSHTGDGGGDGGGGGH